MSRSLKKGPFADESLLKKVDAANASGDKIPRRASPGMPISMRVTPFSCHMARGKAPGSGPHIIVGAACNSKLLVGGDCKDPYL